MLCPSCGKDAGEIPRYCPACGALVPRNEVDDYIGHLVAQKYQVDALIGEGGMGKVYRARQVLLDKVVVLKVLHYALLSDERTVARFRREAKAASRLNHPNSISILDFGQAEDGALFIAMEYVDGKDLHTVLTKEWPLPESRIIRIIGQVLSALADAHRAGVIHRDLKPENIMVEQRRNEPDFVKVLDFGIAKIIDSSGEELPALTRAGFVCGTPEYMSPEQARGATLDHRSDLYAVGVILYQLTTGLLPFEADSPVGFATKHLSEEPLPPSRRRPEARISPAMERLILRTLSKNPNDRPEDAEAFRAELLAVEREARPAQPARRTRASTNPGMNALGARRPTPNTGTAVEARGKDPGWGREETVRHQPEVATLKRDTPLSTQKTELAKPLDVSVTSTGQVPVGGGRRILKVVLLLVGFAALGAGGAFVYSMLTTSRNPLTPGGGTLGGITPQGPVADFDLEIAPGDRNLAKAEERTRLGDQAFRKGELDMAATHYKEAFHYHPSTELSLKLGEIYWQRGINEQARGWWKRHLRDKADSKARPYILSAFPDLAP